MRNEKTNCIFEHADFIYVFNFDKMICWVVQDEDQQDPIATLTIEHRGPSDWWYRVRVAPADAPFTRELDQDWCQKVEAGYAQYINTIIVGDRQRRRKAPSVAGPQQGQDS